MIAQRVALVVLVMAGCKESPKARSERAVADSDFWPTAPTPTTKTGTRTFRYNPDNLKGYVLTATGGTPKGSKVAMEYSLTLDLSFGASATPRARDVKIKKLDMTMDAAGQAMTMRLDDQEMFISEGTAPPVRMKRGDDGPFDIGGMTDKHFTTIVFTDSNRVEIASVADHPFNALGGSGDMLDSALILFPDLPTAAIAPGHTWSVTRNTPVGSTSARVDVTYAFSYLGDGACPSGAASCAHLAFTAASKQVDVETETGRVRGSYGFAGKVFFDTALGTIDESRVHMNIDVTAVGIPLIVSGTFSLRPTPG